MPKISVIVPVYNVEKYLLKCMESILTQTLTDIEIICVDDGSTDHSADILDDFARQDQRVRVIHKENTGYGNTMNIGMRAAEGEYIGIVESDDWILPQFYERLYLVAEKNDLDFVKSDAYFAWEKIGYSYRIHYSALDKFYDKVLTNKERRVFYRFFMNTWTGIYKKSFLQKYEIFHNETSGASYQDNGFWFQTMTFAGRVMWLNEAYYYYRQDNPGASVKDIKKVMAMSKEYDYIEEILQEKDAGEEALAVCSYYRLGRNYGNFYRIDDKCKSGFCERMIQDYEKYGHLIEKDTFYIPWYEEMCKNPEMLCQNVIETKKYVQEKINDVPKIYIYGAGIRGQRIFRSLCYMNLYDKLEGFVESKTPRQACICSKSVKCLQEVAGGNQDALYIISVRKDTVAYMQMRECLDQFRLTRYIDSEDILENFYSLSG